MEILHHFSSKKLVSIFLQPTNIQCQPAINQEKYSFFPKIRLPMRDWRWRQSQGNLYSPGTLERVTAYALSSRFLHLAVFIIFVGAREIARCDTTSSTSCTRKPLKAVRFCWPIIEARRYVKMSRRFLMKPRYLYSVLVA